MKTKLFSLQLILAAFLCVTSCSKDDDGEPIPATLDKTSISLYVDETSTLTYSGENCNWSSDNTLVATVENGIVTAKHVGTTTIHANNLSCIVSVKPKYTMYDEPYMNWGANIAEVKKKMSGYTLASEKDDMLVYLGKGKVNAYLYRFDNNALQQSVMQITLLNSINLTDFLLERYWPVDLSENGGSLKAYMGSVDLKTYVLCNVRTDGVLVMYVDSKSLKTSSNTELKAKLREKAIVE